MNTIVWAKDLLSITFARIASAITSLTAGGAGDNTAVTGLALDLQTLGRPQSLVLEWTFQAVLAAAATLQIKTLVIEDSADNSAWATYVPPKPDAALAAPGVVATGPGGGGTVRGVSRIGVNLTAARRYVRFTWTPDLSAANTDTAIVVATATFAGTDRVPLT